MVGHQAVIVVELYTIIMQKQRYNHLQICLLPSHFPEKNDELGVICSYIFPKLAYILSPKQNMEPGRVFVDTSHQIIWPEDG